GDVGLPPALTTAVGTFDEVPLLVACERAHPGVDGPEVCDERQLDGEIAVGNPHRSATIAIHDRDRGSPITLAGDAPVVQAILHARGRHPPSREPCHDLAASLAAGEPVE